MEGLSVGMRHWPGKAFRLFRENSLAFVFRRALWRIHYERLQWLMKRRFGRGEKVPSVVCLIDKEFELHQSAKGISEELWLFGVHEPSSTKVYLENLSPGDHVLDIGSNLGYFLFLASGSVGETGRILGFEPVPGVYDILQRNVRRLGKKNIEVFPWAMGEENKTAPFYESEIPNWGSLQPNDQLLQTKSFPVSVRKLDDVIKEFPDFRPKAMRMDVEGGELMILKGAQGILKEYHPCLFIEFHIFALGWEAVRDALINFRDLGYSFGTLIDRTWDQPWIGKWARDRRQWTGSIDALLQRVESDPNVPGVLSLILKSPST